MHMPSSRSWTATPEAHPRYVSLLRLQLHRHRSLAPVSLSFTSQGPTGSTNGGQWQNSTATLQPPRNQPLLSPRRWPHLSSA